MKRKKVVDPELSLALIPGNGERAGIKHIGIIAKMTDGPCKQIVIERKTMLAVLNLIVTMESQISIINDPIEGIDLEINK